MRNDGPAGNSIGHIGASELTEALRVRAEHAEPLHKLELGREQPPRPLHLPPPTLENERPSPCVRCCCLSIVSDVLLCDRC